MASPDRVRTPLEKSQNGLNTLSGATSRPASTLIEATTESTKMTPPQNTAPRMNATVALGGQKRRQHADRHQRRPTSQKPT